MFTKNVVGKKEQTKLGILTKLSGIGSKAWHCEQLWAIFQNYIRYMNNIQKVGSFLNKFKLTTFWLGYYAELINSTAHPSGSGSGVKPGTLLTGNFKQKTKLSMKRQGNKNF